MGPREVKEPAGFGAGRARGHETVNRKGVDKADDMAEQLMLMASAQRWTGYAMAFARGFKAAVFEAKAEQMAKKERE